mgnify:CR=1 FL=1
MSENKKRPNAEFIIAFAEGKQLQFFGGLSEEWTDFRGGRDASPEIGPWNSAPGIKWRIKPEQQWVRVGWCGGGDGWLVFAICDKDEENIEAIKLFSHWLSDRLYYTPKERP